MLKSVVVPLVLSVIAAFVVTGYRPVSAATTHSISQINGLANASMAYGSSANREKISGRIFVSPNDRPFVHANGVLTTLGPLPGFTDNQAYDVNDSGQAVGWASPFRPLGFSFAERAFVFSGGTMTQLPVLPGTGATRAFSINNAGTVTGTSGGNHPFKFNIGDAALTQLPFPAGGGGGGGAFNINTASDIVGFEYTTFPTKRPIVWDDGVTATALALPAGATSAEASIINDAGVIAGTALYGTVSRGYYYDASGAPVDMGSLGPTFVVTELFDINSSYQAVGWSWSTGMIAFTPFLYSSGTMVDLNSLLPAGSGWVLKRPISINDAGEIIGTGTFNGTPSGFKLTPIPEPAATIGIILMALIAEPLRRRARRKV